MSQHMEYLQWMNKVQETVIIQLSPTTEQYQLALAEYEALTGTDNPYEHRTIYNDIVRTYWTEWVHNGISLKQAQAIAEPIRIAHPDQNVNICAGKSFIGNTSWNDQLKMFFEYETYTEEGAAIMFARQKEAAQLGIKAAWE